MKKDLKITNVYGIIKYNFYNRNKMRFNCLYCFIFQLDLVLKSDGGDLSDFTTNGEWYLLGKYYFISIS